MELRFIQRKAHVRHLSSGGKTYVRECRVLIADEASERSDSYRHPCQTCGAEVISVRMPNGGWGHFEGAPGSGKIKHPCFYLGEHLSKKRDPDTPDLFDYADRREP